ncbi:hypothetical protein F4811DRAFT_549983 [Daldinia bambusicola]|nr:hypothetical protein F4811DRAFT_549983 [Daldinia bambusicola]
MASPSFTTPIGPLTTTFTPPASCFPETPMSIDKSGSIALRIGTVSAGDGCLPDDWVLGGYYSPGTCPDRYHVACEVAGEQFTSTVCCPLYNGALLKCYPTLEAESYGCGFTTQETYGLATSILAPSFMILNPPDGASSSAAPTSLYSYSQSRSTRSTRSTTSRSTSSSSDARPTGSTSTADPSPSTSEATGPSRVPDAGPSPSDFPTLDVPSKDRSDSSDPGGRIITRGEIAGIILGILGALVLGAAVMFFFMRRRSAKNRKQSPSSPSPPPASPLSRPLPELHDKSRPPEMPDSNALYELHVPHAQPEVPAWNERNPQGPNRPMAWELPA